MAASPRFYLPDLSPGSATLDGKQVHHLLHVLRLKPGDHVELFDGCGHSARAVLLQASRRSAELCVEAVQDSDPPQTQTLTVAVPLPKADRCRWMVEKLTELGVTTLVPIVSEHSVSAPRDHRPEKLVQYVIEACRQSRRNRLMELAEPIPLGDYCRQLQTGASLLVATPEAPRWFDDSRPAPEIILVGPEGGFSPAEQSLFDDLGFTHRSFGPHILRMETAAIAAACIFARG